MIIYTDEIIDNELIHYLDTENVSKFTTMKNGSITLDTEYNEEIVLGFINLFRCNKDSFITGFDKKKDSYNTLEYIVDDMCCEYCYKDLMEMLFLNEDIFAVTSNFSKNSTAFNIKLIIKYSKDYNKDDLIKYIEEYK